MLSFGSFFCAAATDPGKKETNQRSISIHSIVMFSNAVQDTMVIDVSLPKNYEVDTAARYPVLFLFDGYWRRGQHQSIHNTELPASLYIAVGGNEDTNRFVNPFKSLVDKLHERDYTGFHFTSFIDPGKDHYTVWEPALYEGVRKFLSKYQHDQSMKERL